MEENLHRENGPHAKKRLASATALNRSGKDGTLGRRRQVAPRSTASCVGDATYILGHSPTEIRRLIDQAAILQPTTERLLRNAGIEPGMRVLDLGCGAGDVSLLAGKLVGASGSVVGIDRNAEVLGVARKRAQAGGFPQVAFMDASVDTFADPVPFDLVIGRYILIHQADPVAFLRAAACFAKPAGTLAFHEPSMSGPLRSLPEVALWQQAAEWILATFRAEAPSSDAASRLIEHFSRAGLPQPKLFSETPIGGGAEAPHYAWLTGVARTLLPRMVQLGVASEEMVGIGTLENRLKSAVAEARSQIEGPAQICAWASV
jgi:ubiquinone/menaquinone biosynthesis C-methylase UbiE